MSHQKRRDRSSSTGADFWRAFVASSRKSDAGQKSTSEKKRLSNMKTLCGMVISSIDFAENKDKCAITVLFGSLEGDPEAKESQSDEEGGGGGKHITYPIYVSKNAHALVNETHSKKFVIRPGSLVVMK